MVNVINRYEKYHNTYKPIVLAQEAKSAYYTSPSSDEWYTPPDIVEAVLRVLKEIDLDPCAESDKKIPAHLHYTLQDDGLQHEWYGRLFINPPFSCPGKWVQKLFDSILNGANIEGIALLPTATDTDWLNSILKTQPICFLKERIKFLDADYQPNLLAPHSHCLVYWGDNEYLFKEVFEEYGIVYLPVSSKNNHPPTEEVLPVSSTSSTNTKALIQQQSQTVLPVHSTSSTKRRARGKGTGRIHWRTVTKKNGKQYEQAWYDWQLNTETKTISRSTYIPKYLLSIILELEINKAPVSEVLSMLGIIL